MVTNVFQDNSGTEEEAEENFKEDDGDAEGDEDDDKDEKLGEIADTDIEIDANVNQEGSGGNAVVGSSLENEGTDRDADDEQNGDENEPTEDLDGQGDDERGRDGPVQAFSKQSNDDDDDEGPVRIIGRRRRAMAEVHDPMRVRRRKLREYYAVGQFVSPLLHPIYLAILCTIIFAFF